MGHWIGGKAKRVPILFHKPTNDLLNIQKKKKALVYLLFFLPFHFMTNSFSTWVGVQNTLIHSLCVIFISFFVLYLIKYGAHALKKKRFKDFRSSYDLVFIYMIEYFGLRGIENAKWLEAVNIVSQYNIQH